MPKAAHFVAALIALPVPGSFTPVKNTVDLYLTGGPGFSRLTTQGSIHESPNITTIYTAETKTRTDGVYAIAAAYTFTHIRQSPWNLSLGLSYDRILFPTVRGTTVTTSSASSLILNNTYDYNVTDHAMLFEQRATYAKLGSKWQPYVITGFGVSWNSTQDFTGFNGRVTAVPVAPFVGAPPANPPFPGESTTEFAYELGLGIQRPLSPVWAVTADYRYLSFGKARLGNLPRFPTITGHLETPSLASNALLFSLKASF